MKTIMKPSVMRLHAIAMYMETKIRESGFNVNYKVKNVYADFGAGITHDTIVASDVNGSTEFQIFSPAEVKRIENDDFRPADANKVIDKHIEMFSSLSIPRLS